MTVEQVEELCLQRRTRPPAVEVREERILRLLEHVGGIERVASRSASERLADADRSFDRDVLKRHERGAGRSPRGCMLSSRSRCTLAIGMRHAAICLTPLAMCLALITAACASAPTASTRGDSHRSGHHLGREARMDGAARGSAHPPRSESAAAGRAEARDASASRRSSRRRRRPIWSGCSTTRKRACAAAPRWRSAASVSRRRRAAATAARRRRGRSAADGGVRARPDRRSARRGRRCSTALKDAAADGAGARRRGARPDRRRADADAIARWCRRTSRPAR